MICKPPLNPAGTIISYELCFENGDCSTINADDNFFITTEEQRENNALVKVLYC